MYGGSEVTNIFHTEDIIVVVWRAEGGGPVWRLPGDFQALALLLTVFWRNIWRLVDSG